MTSDASDTSAAGSPPPESNKKCDAKKKRSDSNATADGGAAKVTKRRAARACASCRARKVRCNVVEEFPCTNCRFDNVEVSGQLMPPPTGCASGLKWPLKLGRLFERQDANSVNYSASFRKADGESEFFFSSRSSWAPGCSCIALHPRDAQLLFREKA